ncbi:MAG: phage tail tube protein [Shewanella sp.]
MAIFPQKLKSGYGGLFISNGAATPTFEKLCGASSVVFTENFETDTTTDDACDEPESVGYQAVNVTSRGTTVTVAAVYNRTQAARLNAIAGQSVAMEFRVAEPAAPATQVYKYKVAGNFIMTTKEITIGTNNEFVQQSLTFVSDGPYATTTL